jgi:hypothetical protein
MVDSRRDFLCARLASHEYELNPRDRVCLIAHRLSGQSLPSVREMLDLLATFADFGHGFNAQIQVNLCPVLRHNPV